MLESKLKDGVVAELSRVHGERQNDSDTHRRLRSGSSGRGNLANLPFIPDMER